MIAQEGRMTSRTRRQHQNLPEVLGSAFSYYRMLGLDQAVVVLDLRVQMHFIANVNHRDRYVERSRLVAISSASVFAISFSISCLNRSAFSTRSAKVRNLGSLWSSSPTKCRRFRGLRLNAVPLSRICLLP